MLEMAHLYGPGAAHALMKVFRPSDDGDGEATRHWRQHLYVRAMSEFRALQLHLRDYARAIDARHHSLPLRDLLLQARKESPLLDKGGKSVGLPLSPQHAGELIELCDRIEALAEALERARPAIDSFEGKPVAELRLRVPI
jgi:hypothetical protein